jgi:uncharacterized protein YndB with AHSA1/START domain
VPRVSRKRRIAAPVSDIWSIVSDPHHLPRWWPRTRRVENVRRGPEPRGATWTQVFETKGGRGVRGDYRCISAARDERYVYEQLVEDTPFEKVLRSSQTEVRLAPADGETEVTLAISQRLRGLSRLGSPMMRRGTGRILDDALEGLAEAVAAPGREAEEAAPDT